jgi:hypothetical protein
MNMPLNTARHFGRAMKPIRSRPDTIVEFVCKGLVHGCRTIAVERDGVYFGTLWRVAPDAPWRVQITTGQAKTFTGKRAFRDAMMFAETCADLVR